jgi:hypothetical protein
VGTLWQVRDQNAPDVARDVYEWMLGGATRLDNQRSAEGLHRAIRILRHKTRESPFFKGLEPDDPIIWAPYIHLGV